MGKLGLPAPQVKGHGVASLQTSTALELGLYLPESWATEAAVSKGEFKCFKMLKEFSLPQTFFTSRVDRFM